MSDEVKAAVAAVDSIQRAWNEFKTTNDANLKDRDVVLEQKLNKIEETISKVEQVAEQAVLAVKRQQRAAEESVNMEQKVAAFGRHIAGFTGRRIELDADVYAANAKAMNTYLRYGDQMLTDAEKKAMLVASDPAGGYVVNPDMSGRIVQRTFDTSPMRAYASVQTISTDALEGLFDLNEVGFAWVAETATRAETTTADLGRWRIVAHEMSAMPKMTQKLVDDAEVDIETWLQNKIADKFARGENAAFVNGSGVDRPRGFLTYPHGTTVPGTIQQYKTGVDGGFAAAGAGPDVLIDALHGLKAPYRANATWFMNRVTMAGVRKLKDSDGAYFWNPSLAAGQPATILGYPVAPAFEDMPNSTTTDALAIAVGDMRAAYMIVDRVGIRLLRDPYSAKPNILYYATKRVGGDIIDFDALKLVEFSI